MSARPRVLALFGARVIFGAERENMETLATLQELGCEVLCLVRHEDWNDHVPAALTARGLAWRKVPFIDGWLRGWRLWILLRNPIALIVGNWRALRITREFRPTHIHAFSQLHVLSFMPSLLLVHRPLIYRAADVPTRHNWFWRAVWSFVVMRTAQFIVLSRFIFDELIASGVQASRITVVYPIPPKRVTASTAPTVSRDFRNIVFVGQINKEKGPHLLIQAFRDLVASYSDARLLIAGRISEWSGDDWARGLRDSTARDSLLRSKVCFLGFVEDIPSLLRSCHLLVAPSLWEEPLGLVVLEAKEAGIPSVVFPSGGLPEMVEHGVDGFVCHDKTVDALEQALRFYLDDASRTKTHGAAARESLARFCAGEYGSKMLRIYEQTA
jgi:glycosyltransferase involved in cell wall biosynthesis